MAWIEPGPRARIQSRQSAWTSVQRGMPAVWVAFASGRRQRPGPARKPSNSVGTRHVRFMTVRIQGRRMFPSTVPAVVVPHERLLTLLSRWRVNAGTVLVLASPLLARPSRASVLAWLPLVGLGVALRAWARGHMERN